MKTLRLRAMPGELPAIWLTGMANMLPLKIKLAMPVPPIPTFPRKQEKGQTYRCASFALSQQTTPAKSLVIRVNGVGGAASIPDLVRAERRRCSLPRPAISGDFIELCI